ncbi:MAG: heme exporter protein CcmD [Motiliproteus sp.]
MYFNSFSELIDMGGHGLYVWACYGIALTILVFNIVSPLMAKKQFINELSRRLKRERRISDNNS